MKEKQTRKRYGRKQYEGDRGPLKNRPHARNIKVVKEEEEDQYRRDSMKEKQTVCIKKHEKERKLQDIPGAMQRRVSEGVVCAWCCFPLTLIPAYLLFALGVRLDAPGRSSHPYALALSSFQF